MVPWPGAVAVRTERRLKGTERRDDIGPRLKRRREESKMVLRYELRSFGRKTASPIEMGVRLGKEGELYLGCIGFGVTVRSI